LLYQLGQEGNLSQRQMAAGMSSKHD